VQFLKFKRNHMRHIISLLFSIMMVSLAKSQNNSVPNAVKQYAEAAGQKLINCCSSAGGRNLSADIESWEINELTSRLKIIMTVTWNGSLSGNRYWIKGKLICDPDGCNPKWEKIDDSKMFSSGCGTNCVKVCLE
jgi:hypothetical protein